MLKGIHHVAIICSNIEQSKQFYMETLGFQLLAEVYRSERASWKVDLSLSGQYCLELFSFPNPPPRVSGPEAAGLRHLAFSVTNLEVWIEQLYAKGVICEPIRIDPYTGAKFTFCADPDGLPVEFYEVQ